MARLVVELTNRCDLRCPHCFGERHAATGDLSLEIVDKVLAEASACGIDHWSSPVASRHSIASSARFSSARRAPAITSAS